MGLMALFEIRERKYAVNHVKLKKHLEKLCVKARDTWRIIVFPALIYGGIFTKVILNFIETSVFSLLMYIFLWTTWPKKKPGGAPKLENAATPPNFHWKNKRTCGQILQMTRKVSWCCWPKKHQILEA